MAPNDIHEKRCPNCNGWTPAKLETCIHCGFELHKEKREEIQRRRKVDDIHIPIWRIEADDPLWLKVVKRPIQLVQLLLYSIVAFFIYLATAFAH